MANGNKTAENKSKVKKRKLKSKKAKDINNSEVKESTETLEAASSNTLVDSSSDGLSSASDSADDSLARNKIGQQNSDSEESKDSTGALQSDEEIDVEFEAQEFVEEDFHGVSRLLKQSLVTSNVNISELSDILLSQKEIGSTIKVVDDEDKVVYAVSSVISLTRHADKACVTQLKDFLRKNCRSQSTELSKRFDNILDTKRVGLLISERFINIPSDIALPLYETLRSEMNELAAKDSSFQFDNFLLVCKSLKGADDSYEPTKKKKKRKAAEENSQLMFVNFEDDLFLKNSKLSFSYSVTDAIGNALGGDWNYDETLDTYRTVIVIDQVKLDKVIDALKSSAGS